MEFQDRPINCLDCKNEFLFTAGEQEFYDRKGFREVPKRCKPCRDARKAKRAGGGNGDHWTGGNGNGNGHAPSNGHGHANGNGYGGEPDGNRGGGGGRPPREMFDAVCDTCHGPARVPFRPQDGRPVYCKDCFGSRQGQGSGYGGGY